MSHDAVQKLDGPADARRYCRDRRGRVGDDWLDYRVVAEDFAIRDPDGSNGVTLFTFSYLAGAGEDRHRPVSFAFNGGPLSSSVWLHLGALGPRTVRLDDPASPNPCAPYQIEDNIDTLLDVTDLVFLDPIETGYSRLDPGTPAERYTGTDPDSALTADLVRSWLTRHGRWNSPKYVIGESYGSMRAATMCSFLDGERAPGGGQIALNGVVLVGQAVDMTETTAHRGNDVAYALFVPTMAATAWYHGLIDRAGRSFDAFLEDARTFAATGYLAALFAGNTLSDEQQLIVAERLADFIGLRAKVILEHDLLVSRHVYAQELMRDRGLIIGRKDSRFTGPIDLGPDYDPTAPLSPVFATLVNDYLRQELELCNINDEYRMSYQPSSWDFNFPETAYYLNYAGYLADAMRRNTALRCLISTGYFDLTTPFFSAEHMASHSGMARERVSISYHHGGHMNYLGAESRKTFCDDIRQFILHGAHR